MHQPVDVGPLDVELASKFPDQWRVASKIGKELVQRAFDIGRGPLTFISELQRLKILGCQRQASSEGITPHLFVLCVSNAADQRLLSNQLNARFASSDEAKRHLMQIRDDQEIAAGYCDAATLLALDACAILGGYQLPTWPPQLHWCGGDVSEKDLQPSPVA